MAQYLTEEWAEEMTAAANSSPEFVKGIKNQTAVMSTTVTGGPRGDVTYYVLVEAGTVRFGIGDTPLPPDAEARIPYDIAVKVETGEMPPAAAMMTGKMAATGNIMKVMGLAPAFDLLPDLDEQLGTTF